MVRQQLHATLGLLIVVLAGALACSGAAPAAKPADTVAPLAAGQLDVGGGAPSAGLGNALARGLNLKIVADKGSTPPGFGYAGVVIRKDLWDSGVRSPAD